MLAELLTAIVYSAIGSGVVGAVSSGGEKLLRTDVVKNVMRDVMNRTLEEIKSENEDYEITIDLTKEILGEEIELKEFTEDGFLNILREKKEVTGLTDKFLLDFYYEVLKKFEDVFKKYAVENEHAHRLWDVLEDERKLRTQLGQYINKLGSSW